SGPVTTLETSGESGNIVITTSACWTASRIDAAAVPPAAARSSAFCGERLYPVTSYPAATRFLAMGSPMIPSPINAIFCCVISTSLIHYRSGVRGAGLVLAQPVKCSGLILFVFQRDLAGVAELASSGNPCKERQLAGPWRATSRVIGNLNVSDAIGVHFNDRCHVVTVDSQVIEVSQQCDVLRRSCVIDTLLNLVDDLKGVCCGQQRVPFGTRDRFDQDGPTDRSHSVSCDDQILHGDTLLLFGSYLRLA